MSRRHWDDTDEKGALRCGSHGAGGEGESEQILHLSENFGVKIQEGVLGRGRGGKAGCPALRYADPGGSRVLGPCTCSLCSL